MCTVQGAWTTPAGDQVVVLKRVKVLVEGAIAMGHMEMLLNAYAAKVMSTFDNCLCFCLSQSPAESSNISIISCMPLSV